MSRMFTGIVVGKGRVVSIGAGVGAARRIVLDVSALKRRPHRGDSIAVAGTCLTVAGLRGRLAAFDVVGETMRRTTLGALAPGAEVDLEDALRVGDAVGGHEVSGHVDGVGRVTSVEKRKDGTRVRIAVGKDVLATLVPQGFVAVDGASLTVAALSRGAFDVELIPTTLAVTTLARLAKGSRVNVEGDPIGKHVAKWLAARRRRP